MDDAIRTVRVEFLRPGPPHNQLLSPLTQYLAVCGDAGAGTVSMPYEQAAFNRRLGDLRYVDDDEQDHTRRLETLRAVGNELGDVLGQVPGLVGSLTLEHGDRALTNLRIVTSASELALLPFELSKTPSGLGRPSDEWLAMRAGAPVCITRRERSVVPSTRRWAVQPPKVLFIVGLEIDPELEAAHRQTLEEAIAPWHKKQPPPWRDQEPLIQLGGSADRGSSIPEIVDALSQGITLVHVLAHGAEAETTEGERFGLLLSGKGGEGFADVVTGERLASVLQSLPTGTELPTTFVIASCDSAYQADVLVPGGSLARALHVAGVPLIIASQFPLTHEGSKLLAEMFYRHLFWGDNPLPAIAAIRARMHAELSLAHDWASVVVYDALPDDIGRQLREVRFRRAAHAVSTELEKLDDVDAQDYEGVQRAYDNANHWLEYMPDTPDYELAVADRRGSFAKSMAEYAWKLEMRDWVLVLLEDAYRVYAHGARRLIAADVASVYTSLHWMQSQAIALARVLGLQPEQGAWSTAHRAANLDANVDDLDKRMWAHGTLAELWLLRMFDEAPYADEGDPAARARFHARQMLDDFSSKTDHQRWATWKQLDRYAWWGSKEFAELLGERRSEAWPAVVKVAGELTRMLKPS